ncbi:hypothetical protein NLG97_g6055 [Lecanicillium saksenae]|uniref:Uncharacterized protein n=1 Tax=Lecanicillium saksenae TaxID=468837 RepID=A0ACC1QSD3_9HYPO|nr:hypothetical protein NLG97_g6055 [Lecanicillium saksenae]
MLFLLATALLAGGTLTTAASVPQMQVDPATTKDCIDWYDNDMRQTCKEAREMLNITPEEFNDWNPSVGFDCSHWYYASYCVLTQAKLDRLTATRTTATSTKTTTSTLGSSPTSWESLGCYIQSPKTSTPVLSTLVGEASGDDNLTVAKCQDRCYRDGYRFMGLKGGNQCWCTNNVVGDLARNAKECNLPCTGDKDRICGGKASYSVFKAQREEPRPLTVTQSSSTASATESRVSQSSMPNSVGNSAASPTARGSRDSSGSNVAAVSYLNVVLALLMLTFI